MFWPEDSPNHRKVMIFVDLCRVFLYLFVKQRISTLEDSANGCSKDHEDYEENLGTGKECFGYDPGTVTGGPGDLKAGVESLIQQRQKEKQKDILKQMDELAWSGGFSSAAELIESQKGRSPRSDKGVKLPPKYRSQDGKKTWSGKGRVPNWVLEHEEEGGDREDLLIK